MLAIFCCFAWVLLPQLCSLCGNPSPSIFRIHELFVWVLHVNKEVPKMVWQWNKSRTYCNNELINDQRLMYQLVKQLDWLSAKSLEYTDGDLLVVRSNQRKICKDFNCWTITKPFSQFSSVGKESACNTGDPGLIPGLERSAGEGIGYPLQYSWASLVAQLIKNPPAMRETWVCSLGWEDPLEKEKATHSIILVWRTPWTV